MFKKIPVFALAFISGSAIAGPVSALLTGLAGGVVSPVALPGLGGLPTQQLGSLADGAVQPITNAAPLPGLAAGNTTEAPSGDLLSLGVLNEGEPLIGGCVMGECMSTSDIPTLGEPLNGIGDILNEELRAAVVPVGTALGPLGTALEPVTTALPAGTDLFGGPANANNAPDPNINAGVISGDDAGSGGAIGVAALSTGDTAQAGMVGVGVLNGKAGTEPPPPPGVADPIGGNPEEETGGTVIGGNDAANSGDRNALCTILVKDARGNTSAKTKVRCGTLRSPKA